MFDCPRLFCFSDLSNLIYCGGSNAYWMHNSFFRFYIDYQIQILQVLTCIDWTVNETLDFSQ